MSNHASFSIIRSEKISKMAKRYLHHHYEQLRRLQRSFTEWSGSDSRNFFAVSMSSKLAEAIVLLAKLSVVSHFHSPQDLNAIQFTNRLEAFSAGSIECSVSK